MTQTEFRAGRFGGRLFKSAATSALALSAVAGGVMLSGGEAKAVVTVCAPLSGVIFSPAGSAACTTSGDPYVGVPFTNTATYKSGDIPITTFVNLEQTGLGGLFSQQQIDTDFNPPLTGSPKISVYEISTALSTPFNQVDLSWVQVPGGNATVSAKYDWFDSGNNLLGTTTLTNSGAVYEIPGPILPTKITVTNTYTPNSGAIDNVENTFRNVPGPLPILGAGAAFGFSRKLRGRIKASRTA